MVVGAPQIDEVVEAAHHLVVVVGHVAHEVGGLAVALDEHAVLVVAQIGGAEPQGAVLLVEVALLAHGVQRAGHGALAVLVLHVQGALGEPFVEGGAEAGQNGLLVGQGLLVGHLAEGLQALLVGHGEPFVAVAVDNLLGDILHIGAAVAGLGHLHVAAEQLLVAHAHRVAEHVHLVAVVVDVVLLVHVVAAVAHDARHGIAERCPTAVAHVEGARGVGRHVFQVHVTLALGHSAATEVLGLIAHLAHHILEHRIRQADIDKAGARDLHGGNHIVGGNVVRDDLRHLAGVLTSELGAAQSDGARPVAVGLVAGSLQGGFGGFRQLQGAVGTGRLDGGVDDRFERFANFH